eukprot:PhM_4_TR1970/c0_g1_i1/m.43796
MKREKFRELVGKVQYACRTASTFNRSVLSDSPDGSGGRKKRPRETPLCQKTPSKEEVASAAAKLEYALGSRDALTAQRVLTLLVTYDVRLEVLSSAPSLAPTVFAWTRSSIGPTQDVIRNIHACAEFLIVRWKDAARREAWDTAELM